MRCKVCESTSDVDLVGPFNVTPLCRRCINAGVTVEIDNGNDEIQLGDDGVLPTLDVELAIVVPENYLREIMQ